MMGMENVDVLMELLLNYSNLSVDDWRIELISCYRIC